MNSSCHIKLVCEKMCATTHSLLKKPLIPPASCTNASSADSQPDGYITSLKVKQIHKRREPHKHYTYELLVIWSSGANLRIFRRYSNFFEFHVQLCSQQAVLIGLDGSNELANAAIPGLPGRAFIGRSNVKLVAQKRKEHLEEFCENVMKLPQELVRSDIFLKFFSLWPDDTDITESSLSGLVEDEQDTECTEFIAIADYDPTNMHQIPVKAGVKLQVLERRLSGWWLCLSENEQGYLPASILQPAEGIHDNEKVEDFACKHYLVNADYQSNNPDELSLHKGQKVQIVFKSYDGWWRVKCGDATGIVPSLYLTETEHQQRKETLERSTKQELYVTPSNSFRPPPRRGTYGRTEKIVSMYSVLEEIPKDVMNKSSVKYALINKSKNKVSPETEDIIHKMLDIDLSKNPEVPLNYEMSDELVKEVLMTQSLMNSQPHSKFPKPRKPPRKYINPQEMPSGNALHRSPSTPSFADNSVYQNFERVSHTNILSRPIDSNERSLKLNKDKHSASKDDEEIDYINWLPSIEPIDIDEVNEYTVSCPFSKNRPHASLRDTASVPHKSLPKMFVAIEQYTAQNDLCVSFKDGDNASLIERSEDGVWSYVRVNGEEGWSPSEYWKPIPLKKPVMAPPPNIKPTRLTKTVAPLEVPSPAARRLSYHERRPLPTPPIRAVTRISQPTSVPTPPVTSRPIDLPDIPHRTKSPKIPATPLQPHQRDISKSHPIEDTKQYLWGKLTRKDCEDILLQRAKQGEFIFRESPNREGELVLSMRYHYRIHHFNIKQEDGWFCIGENFRVRSLPEIISHFKKSPIASYKEHGDKLIDVFLSQALEKN